MHPNPTTISVPPLDLRAQLGAVNEEKRTVPLVWTTGAGVVRFDWDTGKRYLEVLSLDPAHIRLERLNSSAPLLNTHSAYSLADQIGVVEPNSVKLTKKEGSAVVRFSRRDEVEPIFRDVVDKIHRNVSVGYRVHKFEETVEEDSNRLPVRLATDWEPYEISMVPMGADAGAQTRSSKDVPVNTCVLVTRALEIVIAEDADRFRRLRLAKARY